MGWVGLQDLPTTPTSWLGVFQVGIEIHGQQFSSGGHCYCQRGAPLRTVDGRNGAVTLVRGERWFCD